VALDTITVTLTLLSYLSLWFLQELAEALLVSPGTQPIPLKLSVTIQRKIAENDVSETLTSESVILLKQKKINL